MGEPCSLSIIKVIVILFVKKREKLHISLLTHWIFLKIRFQGR
jgi:hypothetical protein